MSAQLPEKSQFLIYRSEDGKIKLDVRFDSETVWLSQALMAELFQTTVPNINVHIKNILDEGELSKEATIKDFLTVRQEGSRQVLRTISFYHVETQMPYNFRSKM